MNDYNKKETYQHVILLTILSLLSTIEQVSSSSGCLETPMQDKCYCYKSDEGVSVDCQYVSVEDIKYAVTGLSDVHSLTVVELENNDEHLRAGFIPDGVCVRNIRISQTNVKEFTEDTFVNMKNCLYSFSMASSKMTTFPLDSLADLHQLVSLELTASYLKAIPNFSFLGLPLVQINMKGNVISDIAESAFTSLESSLTELDLSENNLTYFPMASIINLKQLRSLKLAWNGLFYIPTTDSQMLTLEHVDLSSNNFEFVSEDCLKFAPSLTSLSFHFNFINSIHYRAFHSLLKLKTIDLSHNRIKVLKHKVFHRNRNLESVDLSRNHLHNINGLFSNLPFLRELHLGDNNILEVPNESFVNSTNIKIINLGRNALTILHGESFFHLKNIEELYLDFNFLRKVPQSIFNHNILLRILKLDHNELDKLDNDTFISLVDLKDIRLNSNKLKYVNRLQFSRCLSLEEIHLHNNKIQSIEKESFKELKNLRYLNLRNNTLSNVDKILPYPISSVSEIHFDINELEQIDTFHHQPHLLHLTINHNRIKLLQNSIFKNLPSIARLDLKYNDISTIEDQTFRDLNATRYLDLSYNFMTSINNYTFLGLKKIEDLNLSFNKIMFIMGFALDSLKILRKLNLSHNPLKKLFKNVFQQGLPLSTLHLDSCDIQFIEEGTFRGLDNLKILSLKNNSLKSIDINSIDVTGLKYLFLPFNIIDDVMPVTFAHFPLLETLVIEHCNVDNIPQHMFALNKHLKRLNLAQNNLSGIPNNFFAIINVIVELNISNNFLNYLPANSLANLTNLELLDLSDNLISIFEISDLKLFPKLRQINLRNNEIKVIVAAKNTKVRELANIDLSSNRLTAVPKNIFESFPRLRYLNLSDNDILNFNLAVYNVGPVPNLINIDLSKIALITCTLVSRVENNTLTGNLNELHITSTNMTNLDDITFDTFPNLQHLYLHNNKLRRLPLNPFLKLNNLEDLDLGHNKISQFKSSNFRGLIKVIFLCLSHNYIESIEPFPEDLSNLKILDLSHNKIQNILNDDLNNLKELTVLYLSHNNIKYISATSTKSLNKLTLMDLQQNKLELLSLELLTSVENYIQGIILKENNLVCNCNKNNTWGWIQTHQKIVDPSSITCSNNEYPKEKCDYPVISQLAVDKHKDNSISVTWFLRNRTAIKALQLLCYEDNNINVQKFILEPKDVSARIDGLNVNKKYILCLFALYENPSTETANSNSSFMNISDKFNSRSKENAEQGLDKVSTILDMYPSSECISFHTFKKALSGKIKSERAFDISTVLNRRMGLMVGCSLGCICFFFMVSILLYTKVKERKRIAKNDPNWAEEMNDYNSVHSKDVLQNSTTVSTDNILLGC